MSDKLPTRSDELPTSSNDSPKFCFAEKKITLEEFIKTYRYNLPQVLKVHSGKEIGKVRNNDHGFKHIHGNIIPSIIKKN